MHAKASEFLCIISFSILFLPRPWISSLPVYSSYTKNPILHTSIGMSALKMSIWNL